MDIKVLPLPKVALERRKTFGDQRNTDGIERKVNKSLNRNKETLVYSNLMIIFSLTEKS
jgi:hypothetical protein